jgi:prolyl oligopeptidase
MTKLLYPKTRRDDEVIDVLHGVPVRDPYRWLEENTPEALAWEAKQNDLTEEVLSQWPDRAQLYQVIRTILAAGSGDTGEPPGFYGRYAFRLGSKPDGQKMVLYVSEGDVGTWRILVDPNTMAAGAALDWFYPSPDGRFVAYGISAHGDEQSVLHVIETETGILLPERILHTSFARVAWLPDSSGFYYSGGKASDREDSQKWLFFHALGEAASREADPYRFDAWYVAPQLSPDGRYLMMIVGEENPRAAYCKDLAGGGGWQPVLQGKPGESYGEFVGDRYLALTTYGAPRGRIVAIPLANARDESSWQEIVPESQAVLRHFVLVDGWLVISELHTACSRLRVVSLDGTGETIVPLPGMGLIRGAELPNLPHLSVRGHQVYFGFSTFTEPLRLYRYDLDTRRLEAQGAGPALDLSHLETQQIHCISKDGTPVSMFLVHRKDLDLSKPRPTLLHGYGGWNLLFAPGFVGGTLSGGTFAYITCVLPFIEAGGVYVFANLRGGAEYGRDWWYAGRLRSKQNTFDDLYAAAEHLIALRITTCELLATMGASNGGLLAAVAVTQRPDLFRAVVSQVPITDMVRAFNDPYAASCLGEYGDPRDAELLPVLLAYSPVHNVKDGQRYSATLIQCGGSDVRCPPWNGRKLVALLQYASSSEAPVLLKVHYDTGHGTGLSLDEMTERDTTSLGFVMQQLGMRVAQPGV